MSVACRDQPNFYFKEPELKEKWWGPYVKGNLIRQSWLFGECVLAEYKSTGALWPFQLLWAIWKVLWKRHHGRPLKMLLAQLLKLLLCYVTRKPSQDVKCFLLFQAFSSLEVEKLLLFLNLACLLHWGQLERIWGTRCVGSCLCVLAVSFGYSEVEMVGCCMNSL